MLIIGNFDLSGTEKFCSHLLREDEETTYCGLKFSKLKGDWQFEESSEFCCVRCRRISATNKVFHADAAMPPSAEPLSGYDIVPAVEYGSQPRW